MALSILLNAATGGHPYQTFSARQHQRELYGKWNLSGLIDWVLGKYHCAEAYDKWVVAKKAVDDRAYAKEQESYNYL